MRAVMRIAVRRRWRLLLAATRGFAAARSCRSRISSKRRNLRRIFSVYEGDWEYMVGGGVATFDCNGDGFADMLLAGGNRTRRSSTATQPGKAAH